jgi:kynurenine 3-monooxygenase
MCRPNNETVPTTNNGELRRVVICGAGPAGLLLAGLLMQRNKELPTPLYTITLVDARQNLALFTQEELKKSFRSWMLGLAGHGCAALKACDGLYDEYCKSIGISVDTFSIHLGSKEIKQTVTEEEANVNDNLIIDRNFICAAVARFVNDNKDTLCTTLYEHKVQYVDYENQRVLIRQGDGSNEFYMPYDLLVGCDGVRSVVREAMIKRHPTFEVDIGDIFQSFKVRLVRVAARLCFRTWHQ